MAPFPFVAVREEAGMSMEKLSRLGTGNTLAAVAVVVAVAERGESPVDEDDMLWKVGSTRHQSRSRY